MFLLGPLKFSFYGFLFLNSQKVTQMVLTLNCNQNKAMTRRGIPVLWVLPNTPSFSSFTSLVAVHTHFPGSPALPQCSCWTGEQPQSPVRELCPISSTCLLQHSTTWEGCLASVALLRAHHPVEKHDLRGGLERCSSKQGTGHSFQWTLWQHLPLQTVISN